MIPHIEKAFTIICVGLAVYMTAKETLRYFKNDDMSTISYKNFASSPQDTYPAFSFCLEKWARYFKKEISLTLSIESPDFEKILMGKEIVKKGKRKEKKGKKKEKKGKKEKAPSEAGFDIRNISEANVTTFTMKLESLYQEIKFKTQHPNDSLTFNSKKNLDKPLPFYVSYQDPLQVCFTRKDDNKENVIRREDVLNIRKSELDKLAPYSKFKIVIHHPNQLLRGIDAPIFGSSIKVFDWTRKLLPFRISQVSILRKRSDANIPCNNDLHDDDLKLRETVVEEVGCNPVYWKTLKSTTGKSETCNTPEEMKEVWNKLQNFSRLFSTYQPSCNEMKFAVTYSQQQFKTKDDSLIMAFKYMDKNYQEIINEREFGLESFWSTVGGLIGIFVGTSLSQLPSFIAITWKCLRNLMK